MESYILEMKNISKEFSGIKALDKVNLKVSRGEIHALCGENGAGKSTLMKILSGVYPHKTYDGDIIVNGEVKRFHSVRDSEKAHISIIYQELALVRDITVAENIFLGKLKARCGIVNWNKIYSESQNILDEMGVSIDLNKNIKDIGIGQQQLIEIAKALVLKSDILILDEPTAALTESETNILINILKDLRDKGVTCILITHKLDEVFAISDRISVLRDGSIISSFKTKETNENEIIKYMVGRELTQRYPSSTRVCEKTKFKVENFSFIDSNENTLVSNINFEVRSGEIVGISGLMGAGRTELISSIFGFMKGKSKGNVYLDGKKLNIKCPKDAIGFGMAMLSEDRKQYGLILEQSISNNISISSLSQFSKLGILNKDREYQETVLYSKEIGVKAPSVSVKVSTLSGGNQQKVLLSRCLMTKPKVLFLDEPTRGIDVGAKYEIYVLMNKLASEGTSIIMISSELPEIIGMSDRVFVMREGKIVAEFQKEEMDQEKIMMKSAGGQ